MAKTVTQLRAIARHALGGKVAPATLGTAALTEVGYVNDAGVLLASLHEWNWLSRAVSLLTITISQNTITLPSALMEVENLRYTDDSVEIKLVSIEELERVRVDLTATGCIYASIYQPTQAAVNAAPGAMILEIAPTPAATVSNALRLRYRSDWTVLASDTDVANVPVWIEPLLEELIRAVAKGREDDSTDARVDRIKESVWFKSAVRRDSLLRVDHGPIVNAIWGTPAVRNDGVIADPS